MQEKNVKTTIILVRHGECAGNREGFFRGRTDLPLNETGRIQAKALAKEVSRLSPALIYSSPLLRARETAEEIGREAGVPVETRTGFTNMALGPWEGLPKQEVRQSFPEEWRLWMENPERLRLPGAETLEDVQRRSFAHLEHIVRLNPGKTAVVVTHRAVLKPLVAACLGIADPSFWRIHVDTASYSILVHEDTRGYCCTLLNETRHLETFVSEWV